MRACAAWRDWLDRRIHVVVEGEQIDPPFDSHRNDLGFGVEIVGLVPQMEAGVGGELRPQRFDRLEQQSPALSPLRSPAPTTRWWRGTPW
jgi:hypothetical protein